MKLQNELSYVENQFKLFKVENVKKHVKDVYKNGKFKNLKVIIAWNLAWNSIPPEKRSEWRNTYNCNDDHLTTLFIKAMDDVFGNDLCDMEK